MRIAFAGNPNSGKTTIYNVLTGRKERVGNWAGVTVEKKESPIRKRFYAGKEKLTAVDLPGAYSMSPFTLEESVTKDYIKNERPDVIINIVDAANLNRSLFFTTQILELGIPVVIALNKSDINEKRNIRIDSDKLSEKLGCPVVKTIAVSLDEKGLKELVRQAVALKGLQQKVPYKLENSSYTGKEEAEEADRKRFAFVNEIVAEVQERLNVTEERKQQDKIDAFLTNKFIGIPVFAMVMFLVFYISQSTVGTWIADWLTGWIEVFQEWIAAMVKDASPFMQSLLVDGIIGGVGAVLGFLPLVMVMYFLIALLEDCGYMARATVVLDPIFKRVGLSGKSVIPMVIGTGCAIPGIMACRTIRNERERRAAAMLTPFMPCGAKLPVIALFAGAFFADAPWVGPLMYLVGIVLILAGALLVNKIAGYQSRNSFFIIELPEYKFPSIKRAALSMLSRGKAYIIKAGTIILVCNAAVQLMQNFNWHLQLVEEGMEHTSILASVSAPAAYALIPIVGVCAWQLAAASLTGFIAKENVVGTLAVCYALTDFIDTEELALTAGSLEVAAVMGLTKAGALAYLMFNLYTPPCFAALGAMNAELQSKKWLWGGIALLLGTGYSVAFFVYQFGTLFTTGSFGAGFFPGLVIVTVLAGIAAILIQRGNKYIHREYGLE